MYKPIKDKVTNNNKFIPPNSVPSMEWHQIKKTTVQKAIKGGFDCAGAYHGLDK